MRTCVLKDCGAEGVVTPTVMIPAKLPHLNAHGKACRSESECNCPMIRMAVGMHACLAHRGEIGRDLLDEKFLSGLKDVVISAAGGRAEPDTTRCLVTWSAGESMAEKARAAGVTTVEPEGER